MKPFSFATALTVAAALSVAGHDASACGSCVAQPGSVQLVTDHRMVLALGADRTTLWDQMVVQGDGREFAWILPLQNATGATVDFAAPEFMDAVDDFTAPFSIPPVCAVFNSRPVQAPSPGATPVGVPEILHGEVPGALATWLAANDLAMPQQHAALIAQYEAVHSDYIAVRFQPPRFARGTRTIAVPVRVRMRGLCVSLPLRSISIGTGDTTGVVLIVVAPSRQGPMGFPERVIPREQLVWDYDRTDLSALDAYLRVFRRTAALERGRTWIAESVAETTRAEFEARISTAARARSVTDLDVAFGAQPERLAVVTRLRAELPAPALDQDLQLQAVDGPVISREYHWSGDAAVCDARPGGGDSGGGVIAPPGPDARGVAGDAGGSHLTGGASCACRTQRPARENRQIDAVVAAIGATMLARRGRRR